MEKQKSRGSRTLGELQHKVQIMDKRILDMQPVAMQEARMAGYIFYGISVFLAGYLAPVSAMSQRQSKIAILVILFLFSANSCVQAPVLYFREENTRKRITKLLWGTAVSRRELRKIRILALGRRMVFLTMLMLLLQWGIRVTMKQVWPVELILETVLMMLVLGGIALLQILSATRKENVV